MLILAGSANPDSLEQVAPLLFVISAGVAVVSAWAVALSRDIVRMAMYLLLTLVGVAGLYFMLCAEFLAAIQLIVYAGGTLVLIVFGVMLTSKDPHAWLKIPIWERLSGLCLGVAMAVLLIFAFVLTPIESAQPTVAPTVRDIGHALLTSYLVPFEIAAVLLLIVMIGAAYMARRRRG